MSENIALEPVPSALLPDALAKEIAALEAATEGGAATLTLLDDPNASPRARARARLADALVREGRAILDAPLDISCPGPDATRASNRAQYRLKQAEFYARFAYGPKVEVNGTLAVAVVQIDWRALLNAPPKPG